MIRMSVPLSRRWVAKLWRSVWTLTRLVSHAAFVADRQAEWRQKARHLIGAQDRRQLARRARINNPLGDLGAVQHHAV